MLGVDHAIADAVVQWRDAESGVPWFGDNSLPIRSRRLYRFLKDCFRPRHGWREKKNHRAAHDEAEGNRRGGLGGGLKGNQQRRRAGKHSRPKET